MNDTQLAARLGVYPCKRVSDTDPWCQIHDCIWRCGSRFVCDEVLDLLDMAERGMELITPILTDLIAELRAWSDSELLNPDTELHVNRMADRAEARLKEIQGE